MSLVQPNGKKRKRIAKKGRGDLSSGQGDPKPPRSLTLSLSLWNAYLSLSLSHRRPAAWCHRRPSCVAGNRRSRPTSPTQRLSHPLHHRNPPTSHLLTPTRLLAQNRPSTCRKSTTHHHPCILYKLEPKIEPQTATNITKSRARVRIAG